MGRQSEGTVLAVLVKLLAFLVRLLAVLGCLLAVLGSPTRAQPTHPASVRAWQALSAQKQDDSLSLCEEAILRCCTPNQPATKATWRCFEANSCEGLFTVHSTIKRQAPQGACNYYSKVLANLNGDTVFDEEDSIFGVDSGLTTITTSTNPPTPSPTTLKPNEGRSNKPWLTPPPRVIDGLTPHPRIQPISIIINIISPAEGGQVYVVQSLQQAKMSCSGGLQGCIEEVCGGQAGDFRECVLACTASCI